MPPPIWSILSNVRFVFATAESRSTLACLTRPSRLRSEAPSRCPTTRLVPCHKEWDEIWLEAMASTVEHERNAHLRRHRPGPCNNATHPEELTARRRLDSSVELPAVRWHAEMSPGVLSNAGRNTRHATAHCPVRAADGVVRHRRRARCRHLVGDPDQFAGGSADDPHHLHRSA